MEPNSPIFWYRFWSKIEFTDKCWNWLGCKDTNGYGYLSYMYKNYMAHRITYQRLIGSIPKGLQLDHLCRNRHCVNPNHLEPVTTQENTRRGNSGLFNKSKTHCKREHEYTKANTYIYSDGRRECRQCRRK